jgi:hypothetical protein
MYCPTAWLAALLLLISLGGCAEQRRAEAQAAIQKQVADCRIQYPGDTHYLDRTNCEAPVRRAAMSSTGVASDFVDLYLADRAQLAAQIDSGRMTKEEANAAMARASVEINQMAGERNRQNALAAAAILSAMPQPPLYQLPMPPQTHTTNCMRMGSMINCTTN